MLDWSISLLIIAIIAALLGFTNIAGTAIEMARIVFVVFIILWRIAAIANALRGRGPKK